MSHCSNCGKTIADQAKFCPFCGAQVFYAEQAPTERAYAAQEAPAGNWYQSAAKETAPLYGKPIIGGVFDFYRKVFSVLGKKPVKLWGLSLLYLFVASLISALGAGLPLLSIPIVLVLAMGFAGVLLAGYRGEETGSKMLFDGFKKEELVRNGAGMCWMELWMLIWGFVPVMNIIKAYSYSFVPYILSTDKEISATEALRKSMRMTDGYKGKMFGADILMACAYVLALILFALLGSVSYVGWLFRILFFLVYLGGILFLPLVFGLLRTAFFDEISKVHVE